MNLVDTSRQRERAEEKLQRPSLFLCPINIFILIIIIVRFLCQATAERCLVIAIGGLHGNVSFTQPCT